jgi:hypothetical protein
LQFGRARPIVTPTPRRLATAAATLLLLLLASRDASQGYSETCSVPCWPQEGGEGGRSACLRRDVPLCVMSIRRTLCWFQPRAVAVSYAAKAQQVCRSWPWPVPWAREECGRRPPICVVCLCRSVLCCGYRGLGARSGCARVAGCSRSVVSTGWQVVRAVGVV